MGVQTFTVADITSPVAPKRLFQALSIDNHNFIKNFPDRVKSIEFIQGDSTTVGCIKQINLPDGHPIKYVKNRVDEIDFDKLYTKYTTIEGGTLGDNLECIGYENKFEASGEGCRYTMIGHYHTKGDAEMKEEQIAAGKEAIKNNFKVVEEYLIAHPQLYA